MHSTVEKMHTETNSIKMCEFRNDDEQNGRSEFGSAFPCQDPDNTLTDNDQVGDGKCTESHQTPRDDKAYFVELSSDSCIETDDKQIQISTKTKLACVCITFFVYICVMPNLNTYRLLLTNQAEVKLLTMAEDSEMCSALLKEATILLKRVENSQLMMTNVSAVRGNRILPTELVRQLKVHPIIHSTLKPPIVTESVLQQQDMVDTVQYGAINTTGIVSNNSQTECVESNEYTLQKLRDSCCIETNYKDAMCPVHAPYAEEMKLSLGNKGVLSQMNTTMSQTRLRVLTCNHKQANAIPCESVRTKWSRKKVQMTPDILSVKEKRYTAHTRILLKPVVVVEDDCTFNGRNEELFSYGNLSTELTDDPNSNRNIVKRFEDKTNTIMLDVKRQINGWDEKIKRACVLLKMSHYLGFETDFVTTPLGTLSKDYNRDKTINAKEQMKLTRREVDRSYHGQSKTTWEDVDNIRKLKEKRPVSNGSKTCIYLSPTWLFEVQHECISIAHVYPVQHGFTEMNHEWNRLVSYNGYEGNGNTLRLARNGFFHYARNGQTSTICYFCHARRDNWQPSDNIEAQHNRDCPLHRYTSNNIPIDSTNNQRPGPINERFYIHQRAENQGSSNTQQSTGRPNINTHNQEADFHDNLPTPNLYTGGGVRLPEMIPHRRIIGGPVVDLGQRIVSLDGIARDLRPTSLRNMPFVDLFRRGIDLGGASGRLEASHRAEGAQDITVMDAVNTATPRLTCRVVPEATTPEGSSSQSVTNKSGKKKKEDKKPDQAAGVTASGTSDDAGASGAPVNEEVNRLLVENEKLRDALTCKICKERPVNTTLLPCGHFVCCDICAARLRDCPVCGKKIKGTVKTFMS